MMPLDMVSIKSLCFQGYVWVFLKTDTFISQLQYFFKDTFVRVGTI